MRQFDTGATRDTAEDKPDYHGYLSPLVIERFGAYMLRHQKQADGKMRASDNWKKGMPKDAYIKSGFRHFMDWWMEHDGYGGREDIEEALCALLFNVSGYLHEHLKEKTNGSDFLTQPLVSEGPIEVHYYDGYGRPINVV